MSHLEPLTTTKLTIGGTNPKEYFVTGNGLHVFSDFRERIVAHAEPMEEKEFDLSSFKLTEPANDEEIETDPALPKPHIFTPTEICAILPSLIEKQKNGEEGLLSTERVNLFYTKEFVVDVDWDGDDWGVGAWSRDGFPWYSDYRVFSPATVA